MTQIVHVLTWRLNGATVEVRRNQGRRVVAAVQALLGRVEGLVSLDVGVNLVEAGDAWDVGAVMVFRNRADLQAYQTHPAHLALKAVVGPLRSERGQLDFERTAAPGGEELTIPTKGHPP